MMTFFGCGAMPVLVGIGDEVERIAGAGVLGQAVIVDIGHPAHRVEHDILQHRAKAGDRRVDLGLGGRRQVDHLGVAAALEIEDARRAPAMLVIADEGARGIGRERRLAGAGEAEEDRAVALRADIGRAMHRQDVARRQHEVEIAEHRFLDLAGVSRAADQHKAAGEIDQDEGLRADAVELRHRMEIGRVQDREGRLEIRQLRRRRPDEHVAREEAVPGAVG